MSSNAVEGIIEVLSNDSLGLNHIFLVDQDGKQHQICMGYVSANTKDVYLYHRNGCPEWPRCRPKTTWEKKH